MIDRIEELLSKMAAEDDEEEQREDVLALPVEEESVQAAPHKGEGKAGKVGTDSRSGGRTAEEIASERPGLIGGVIGDVCTGDRSGGRTAEEIASERPGLIGGAIGDVRTGDRSGGRTAEEIASERPGLIGGVIGDVRMGDRSGGRTAEEIASERPGLIGGVIGDVRTGDRSGGRTAGEIALDRPGLAAGETAAERAETAGELWKDGPVWTVRSVKPEIDRAQRAATAERTAQTGEALQTARDGAFIWAGLERAARGSMAGLAPEGAGRLELSRTGLEGLYRRTVQGLRPAAPALPPEQAGRTVRAQEPGSAASLAVDELDRAVRRDSRRYDGGMSIY